MKLIVFLITLYKEAQKDDLISAANDLTYKMLFSLFPLIIFLLSVLSYFEMDTGRLLSGLRNVVPGEVATFISPFFKEVLEVKRPSVLSVSLVFTLFSASGGFISVMRGINKAYGLKDKRNFFVRRFISIWLVFVFTVSIILSMVMLIFNEYIQGYILNHVKFLAFTSGLFSVFAYVITVFILLLSVLVINKVSLAGKQSIKDLFPGAVFTVFCWVILSRAFDIYVDNFSSYSRVYGSVAGILILMIWLNMMSAVLLFGSEISAMLKGAEN